MGAKIINIYLCLMAFIFIISCAKTDEALVRSAVQEAKYHLSGRDCSKAMSALNDVSFQEDNADYISTYASAQACEAGYAELSLFTGSLSNIDASDGGLLRSLAAFESSNETQPDSSTYEALHNAITTLISYDGTTSPSTASRSSKFGEKKAGDLSMQAMYLLLVQIGKHFALYGNGDADGIKGQGSFNNSCIFSYTTQDAVEAIAAGAGGLGTCVNATGSEGSDFLEAPVTSAVIQTRLCKGIIYWNNLIDILGNIALPGSDELGNVGSIASVLSSIYDAASIAESGALNDGPADSQDAVATLRNVRSLTACEAESFARVEKFYAFVFELGYQ